MMAFRVRLKKARKPKQPRLRSDLEKLRDPECKRDFLDLCVERRDLKKKRYEVEGAEEYREANKMIQKAVKKPKEIRARGYKTFFMLHSAEREILNAHKYKYIKKFSFFQAQISLECYFSFS